MLMTRPTPLDQPRAIGRARVSSKLHGGASRLDGLHQAGALRLLFPRAADRVEATVINTAGGITGGDRFRIDATAGPGSVLSLSTQAAERVYRAQPGQTGHLTTTLRVGADACLHWLPQETILYDGSALSRRLRVELHTTARLVMVEPVVFGRLAMGETLADLRFDDRIAVSRAGREVYRDGIRLRGDASAELDRPAVAHGARAMASLVYAAPDAGAHVGALRDLIGDRGGVSLLEEALVVLRLLARDAFDLRAALLPVLDRLTAHRLPRCWRL
ncbi:urease accessory protein UreD [Sulfitobacter sabulilitoris]|uniref:Urease accessory protein UreD n=2 Tax=Sulfitobacter sabulilitoris TaxID=2562655 RepID=A0A5S3PDC0_9RHOB|nr:urease accessory protein UreD [Sulfitobacter sabulilitoris]TMM51826.1 urease accessory protein UreD [Sulfitobacter sabulilitoris]